VPDIEIRLSSIIGNKDFAMLKWIHSAGIYVEIWIELLHRDADTAGH
jgi:hypothetical protein